MPKPESSLKKGEDRDGARATQPLGFSAVVFRRALIAWYRENARMLPWRGVNDPYATWLSEIMLQQTRVATVIDRYGEFLRRFPTIRDLAAADEEAVLALWSGLGYYRRARMLHRGAQFVEREMGGRIPKTATELRTLPGVGEYTSAAIASIAFGQRVAVLDGNVERVLLRLSGGPEERSDHARAGLLRMAQKLMPPGRSPAGRKLTANAAGDHNQAMMELGAVICLPRAPLCGRCPVFALCKTRGEHPVRKRGKMFSRNVAHVLATRKRGVETEILLERRPASASLMAGMLELPEVPVEGTDGREPVLRLRHAITTTNYYAQIFTESVLLGAGGEGQREDGAAVVVEARDEPFGMKEVGAQSLVGYLGERMERLEWVAASRLAQMPLTGLTRKVLQRLHLMMLPEVRFDAGGDTR